MFLKFCKYFSYVVVAGLLDVASCSFGVDGTGSKSDPELYEEYKQNMLEMGEKYKKWKMGIGLYTKLFILWWGTF